MASQAAFYQRLIEHSFLSLKPFGPMASGGSVMRCSAWLALGQHVGATLDGTPEMAPEMAPDEPSPAGGVVANESTTLVVPSTTEISDSLDGDEVRPPPV